MGLFHRRNVYDPVLRQRAIAQVPGWYMQVWREREAVDVEAGYELRLGAIDEAIARVEKAQTDEEAMEHASSVVATAGEADAFVGLVRDGRHDELRALALWEAHLRTFPVAMDRFFSSSGLTVSHVFETADHEWELHAECLVRLRGLVSLGVWDSLIDRMSPATHSHVTVPRLRRVRRRWKDSIPGLLATNDSYEGGDYPAVNESGRGQDRQRSEGFLPRGRLGRRDR